MLLIIYLLKVQLQVQMCVILLLEVQIGILFFPWLCTVLFNIKASQYQSDYVIQIELYYLKCTNPPTITMHSRVICV